ncbi:MAG: hypothetical protein E7L17_07400 [Clostridium sp.]|uniref:hypothetical protein n=1 Tax=Clostridium sp. TaxID=1506 RepID=UPI002912A3A2|nr:hypothetical protein [Clostridium sp.]MDU7337922.1 hypothetical protein [Clostridium sp.]
MQINFKNVVISIRISESAIMQNGCYYLRPTDDSETYVIGLDVLQLFKTGSSLFKMLRWWTSDIFKIPFTTTGKAILIDSDAIFGMSIQANCTNNKWCYSLTIIGVVDGKTESASFEILSFTPGEQRLINRYVDEISNCVRHSRGRVIGMVR